jgi:hypothetical protein
MAWVQAWHASIAQDIRRDIVNRLCECRNQAPKKLTPPSIPVFETA